MIESVCMCVRRKRGERERERAVAKLGASHGDIRRLSMPIAHLQYTIYNIQ